MVPPGTLVLLVSVDCTPKAKGRRLRVDVDRGRFPVDRCVLELSRFRDNSRERVLEGHTCPPPLWAFGVSHKAWGLLLGAPCHLIILVNRSLLWNKVDPR